MPTPVVTPAQFAKQVEEICARGAGHLEAVVIWCEERGYDIEVGAQLVKKNESVRAKIELEAEETNSIKRGAARLPV